MIMGRADLAKQPQTVAAMFDEVADGYDRTDTLISFGLDRRWRRAMVAALTVVPDMRVVDVAAGTAISTAALAKSGAWSVAVDFSEGMLRAGARKRGEVPKVVGDALHLPFADASVDAVTISFGLRNVVDPGAALAEFARITKPGGQLVVCEFSQPYRLVRPFYRFHRNTVLPRLAKKVASNPEAYHYLVESIDAWPAQAELAGTIAANGWHDVAWRNLTFGTVALHHAIRD